MATAPISSETTGQKKKKSPLDPNVMQHVTSQDLIKQPEFNVILPSSQLESLNVPTKIVSVEGQAKKNENKTTINNPTSPEVMRDEQGRLSGITMPTGETYLGLNPADVNKIVSGWKEQTQLPEGAVEPSKRIIAQRQAEILEKNTQIANQVGINPSVLDNIEASKIDYEQAIGSGLSGAMPGLAGLGAAAALSATGVGAIAGVPIAAVSALSVAGTIGGFLAGVRSNMKSQLSGEISAEAITISKVEKNLRALITDTNKNPQNAIENLEMFNYQLMLADQQYQKLKLDTQGNLAKFLGEDGTRELQRFALFNSEGGTRQYLQAQMQAALISPNPNKNFITMEDLAGLEENEE